MLQLLQSYSITEILMFLVMFALAIKEIINFYDWAKKRIKEPLKAESQKEKTQEEILGTLDKHTEQIEGILKILDILTASDKDDIKAWITEKHHLFCYELGYIDDWNYQCIESRYQHYKEEEGNTFIDGFMDDIRQLPKISPIQKEEQNK